MPYDGDDRDDASDLVPLGLVVEELTREYVSRLAFGRWPHVDGDVVGLLRIGAELRPCRQCGAQCAFVLSDAFTLGSGEPHAKECAALAAETRAALVEKRAKKLNGDVDRRRARLSALDYFDSHDL